MEKVIGFTAGTFDMFHVGHLNLLRNAKNHCDYLVVGVNTNQLVKQYKKKEAIVPLDERMEIVAAIRYTDEVITIDSLDKRISWEKIHYQKLFIGDDWKGSERWMKTEKEMREFGVEVCYLPYTRETCSTMLREKLLDY